MSHTRWSIYDQAVRTSTTNTLWTTLFVLVVMLVFIVIYGHLRGDKGQPTTEKYVGNVGGQNNLDTRLSAIPAKKQLGCYSDMDCPDQTKCSDKGICTPIIHSLPRTPNMMRLGRGRGDEKPSG